MEWVTTSNESLGYSPGSIVLNMLLALTAGLIIGWVYRKTHRGLSYSQSFVVTLVLMCVTVSAVMMVIGSNLARASLETNTSIKPPIRVPRSIKGRASRKMETKVMLRVPKAGSCLKKRTRASAPIIKAVWKPINSRAPVTRGPGVCPWDSCWRSNAGLFSICSLYLRINISGRSNRYHI